MTESPVIVLNPNSSEAVTTGIEESVLPLALDEHPIRCVTLPDGPAAIESHADFEGAIPRVVRFVAEHESETAAFVIACFSDPGVAEARLRTTGPVIGIQEASVDLALTLGARFGILALADASVERQQRSLRATGRLSRLAASRPVGVALDRLLRDSEHGWPAVRDTGARLRDEDGADVLVLGCAGMGAYRARLEDDLGIPVIDPCRAGVSAALTALRVP